MPIILDGTEGIDNNATDLSYTGTLTGGTGVVNLGSGQVVKDASGNVGIGTSSPNHSLHVLGVGGAPSISNFTATATNADAGIVLVPNGTGVGSIRVAVGALTFNPGGTERARIDPSGNLLVGTTSQGGSAFTRLFLKKGGTTWQVGPGAAGSGNNFWVLNSSDVGVVLLSGNTSWSANSDERLKTTLTPFANAAEKVASLRAGTGRYLKDDESVSRSFLIAQDVQAVLPEAVDVGKDEIGTLGLRYTEVIPLLVAAIQELKAINDAQAQTIESLTARVVALEQA